VSWPVYSTRFIRTSVATTWMTYTVPAGKRAVVKSISASNSTAAAGTAYVNVAGTAVMNVALQAKIYSEALAMAHVAYAGETISGYLSGPNMSLVVSGYLLDDPGGMLREHREAVQEDPQPPPPAGELELS